MRGLWDDRSGKRVLEQLLCGAALSSALCPSQSQTDSGCGLAEFESLAGLYVIFIFFFFLFLRSKLKMEDIKEVNKALKVLDCCRY